jgi:preprotein translocase subunit YajC
MGSLWTLIPLIGIFYFFLIMPEQKRQKKTRAMMSSLKTGDTVYTRGGIFGTIVNINDDIVTLATGPDKIRIDITRGGIGSVVSPAEAEAAATETESKKETLEISDKKNEENAQ